MKPAFRSGRTSLQETRFATLASCGLVFILAALHPTVALGQQGEGAAASVAYAGSASSPTSATDSLLWSLRTAEARTRVPRNALFAGAGMTAVGLVFTVAWAAKNCTRSDGQSICATDSQPGLAGAGALFLVSGSLIMLSSGIVLGVRNGKRRHLLKEADRERKSSAHWDAESGLLRF